MKRLLVPVLVLCAPLLHAEVNFSGLDLSSGNQLLFQSDAEAPGFGHYRTLFSADLDKKTLSELTFFPERVQFLGGENVLEIQNRYGLFRTDSHLRNIAPVALFPAFVAGGDILTGKIPPVAASPDGSYLLYLKPTSFARADLVLYRLADRSSVTISSGVELSLDSAQAAWSPDSRFFVYANSGRLYYYAIEQLVQNRVLAEPYRLIGKGTIASVRWSPDGSLYLVSDTLVYQILTADLFAGPLYAELLSLGRIVGKIPFGFDPNFDAFWISPDGQSILLDKAGRNLVLLPLRRDDDPESASVRDLPFLRLPPGDRVAQVLWARDGIVTLLTRSALSGAADPTRVFRLNTAGGATAQFVQTGETGVTGLALSPDGSRVAVLKGDEVIVRDYPTWQDVVSFAEPAPLRVLWESTDEMIVAGAWLIDDITVSDRTTELVALSQPGDYGYSTADGSVTARVQGRTFALAATSPAWEPLATYSVRPARLSSSSFRVYIDGTQTGSYQNMVMIRDIKGLGTQPLFKYPDTRYESFPTAEGAISFTTFDNGSRIRRREVALVFNAINTDQGLTTILATLKEYGLRCTFFVNGEFMRRNPEAVREIADSGQEVGSLFFANFDLTDARYRIDSGFVESGLARNEDDYYKLTGKELSLLWHAPYYLTTSAITAAARSMNYLYVGSDVDTLDWVTQADGNQGARLYLGAADLVERVMRLKKPGSIIPIRVGKPDGVRADYLFDKLDVLINGLVSLGYSIVPVSTLIEHAR